MSCTDDTCGTGGWSGPKPGDPNNDVTLSAKAVFGGIELSWGYPTVNPHAVAFSILYRGATANFDAAVKLGEFGGSMHYDRIDLDVATKFYYWVRIISVNGSPGEVIGPVSATSKPRYLDTLESLAGRIDNSVLAQALKTAIGGITTVDGRVAAEIQDRINANAGLSAALLAAQTGAAQAITFVQNEITQRTEGDAALVNSLTTLSTAVGNNFALFQNERTLRTSKDASYAQDFTLLYTKVGQNAAAVQTETVARVNADGALASRITTAEVSLNGNVATGEVGLITHISTVDGKISDIGSLYTAKVAVNGLIGGFGVYNDGRRVDAGFDVDIFWVGRTGPDKVKPFIIDQGVVYIDKARIRNADIDTLKIAGNSVMTGVYDSGGTAGITAGGTTNLITRTIDLGDGNNSGVIVTATVSVNGGANATVGFRVLINGFVAGDQRASILGGFGYLFPVSGFAPASGARYVTVQLQAYNPTSLPGSNVPFNVTASTIAIMGGKR